MRNESSRPRFTQMGNDTRPSPMSEKQLTDQLRERIGEHLRDYYRSCISEELPPPLLAVLKKLNEATEVSDSQLKYGDIKS